MTAADKAGQMFAEKASRFRYEWPHLLVVFLVVLTTYAVTSSHSVGLEDDGLFVLSSYYAGISHPPGYPLYTLIGKLFTWLPFGSIAYRVHLASAVQGAAACATLWWCVFLLVPGRLAAYAAALSFAFSTTFWSQSIVAEVYSLNCLFFFLLLALCLQLTGHSGSGEVTERRQVHLLRTMAFIFGLSLTNHWPLMVLCAPVFLVLVWPERRLIIRKSPVLLPIFLLGLTPYLWMVLRSQADPQISFYGPLRSFTDFWYMLSREGFASADSSSTSGITDKIYFGGYFIREALTQLSIAGFFLAALGFVKQGTIWDGRTILALITGFLFPSLLLIGLLGFDYDLLHIAVFRVYPLVAYGVMAIWLGLGVHQLERLLGSKVSTPNQASLITGAIVSIVVVAVFFQGFQKNDRSAFTYPADYAHAVLESLPVNAIFFAEDDVGFATTAYVNLVDGFRPDVTIYQTAGLVLSNRLYHPFKDTPAERAEAILKFLKTTDRPVFFIGANIPVSGTENQALYSRVSKDWDAKAVTVFDEQLFGRYNALMTSRFRDDEWLDLHRGFLSESFGLVLGASDTRDESQLVDRMRQFPSLTDGNFMGLLGIARGMVMRQEKIYPETMRTVLENVENLLVKETSRRDRALYLHASGIYFISVKNNEMAERFLEASINTWPDRKNPAFEQLISMYGQLGRSQEKAKIETLLSDITSGLR